MFTLTIKFKPGELVKTEEDLIAKIKSIIINDYDLDEEGNLKEDSFLYGVKTEVGTTYRKYRKETELTKLSIEEIKEIEEKEYLHNARILIEREIEKGNDTIIIILKNGKTMVSVFEINYNIDEIIEQIKTYKHFKIYKVND